jgi:double-stranded uracil-DNA glycosylase
MADRARSFPPISTPDASVLILGSMPGQASLAASQYYAHPRNAFWPIMATLLGFDAALDYPARTKALADAGIAVWDVLHSCHRPGSLDSSIEAESLVVNDLAGFLAGHRAIKHIFFNGSAAEALFRKHVGTDPSIGMLNLARLPSTSPAHAAQNFAQKLAVWRAAFVAVDPDFQAEISAIPSSSTGRRFPSAGR